VLTAGLCQAAYGGGGGSRADSAALQQARRLKKRLAAVEAELAVVRHSPLLPTAITKLRRSPSHPTQRTAPFRGTALEAPPHLPIVADHRRNFGVVVFLKSQQVFGSFRALSEGSARYFHWFCEGVEGVAHVLGVCCVVPVDGGSAWRLLFGTRE
jgi:hypothetical protein